MQALCPPRWIAAAGASDPPASSRFGAPPWGKERTGRQSPASIVGMQSYRRKT
jgi:hypothetical protein